MSRTLSAYVHVPFCATRCGYCDFNTYTASELSRDNTSVSPSTYADRVIKQIEWHAQYQPDDRKIYSIFFGGGTPTMLPAKELGRIVASLQSIYGIEAGAEVTTEANPDSVDEKYINELREGGFTRVSFGHQSSSPRVLEFLERTHTAGRTGDAVKWARAAGFEHVSVDLIYGSQVETEADLKRTLDDVAQADVDHVSAYSLIVETGTRLGTKVARGEVPPASDDVAAQRYPIIDSFLRERGFDWYEVSNWAKPHGECKHNIAYWNNQDWLGIGPGAHAHTNGLRAWNIKHPAAWAQNVDAGQSPFAGSETLNADEQRHEDIMLQLRLREGLHVDLLSRTGTEQALTAVNDGLLTFENERFILTDAGRLLADGLVTRLWD